jgi:hypothetical protein
MHLYTRIALVALISTAPFPAFGQDNAIVLLNANPNRQVCVVADIADAPVCPVGNGSFLVQGQRNQLRVINRKFLTNYSFFIDSKISVTNFPIEDLDEAANLTTPLSSSTASGVSKGAAPKGLATNGALALRTAQDLLAELLNPATSSNPANEIGSDWLVVRREVENVRTDAVGFEAIWTNIHRPPAAGNPCLPAFGAPTLISADACLDALNAAERSGSFPVPVPAAGYSDEDAFRKLVVRDNDAIAMVTSLGSVLTQQTPLLTSQLSAFDGDLALFVADMNTLAGNVQSLQDSVDLLDSITPAMTKAQIKARLIQALNGGSKPVLDDAELNLLTNEYYAFTRSDAGRQAVSRAKLAIGLLWLEGRRQTEQALLFATALTPTLGADRPCTADANGVSTTDRNGVELGCLADQIGLRYTYVLEQNHRRASDQLSTEIAGINTKQSDLLARANEIYDSSLVTTPLDKAIDLGGSKGNLRVYFTIYETESFPRFAIPPSTPGGASVAGGTPAIVATPVPTTTSSAATTAPTQPSGTPIPGGMVEVHDRYKATVVAAFAFSKVKETSILTNTVSTGMASGSTPANPVPCTSTTTCTEVTVSPGPIHSSAIVGLSYHPWGYDTFPGAYSWSRPKAALKQGFGIFGGLSVQNLNDYYAGIDFQIAHGLQIMGGANFFRRDTLAEGFTNGGIYLGSPNFKGPQQWAHGAYVGFGLNLSIFRKVFGSVTQLGSKAASTGT